MRIIHLTPDEAIASLRSQPTGLSSPEARRRLAEYGPNRVEEMKHESLVLRFLKEFTHFFALILWVAAVLAFVAEFVDPGQGMAALGFAVLGVIVVNGVFSFWQEYRAEQAISALRRLLPRQVTVLRDAINCRLPADDLVPGDVILVDEGDSVPADCRLIEAAALRVNLATVTGESLPKSRNASASTEDDPLRSHNALLAGSSVVAGNGKAVVFATGMHTEFGKIARLTQMGREPSSPLQKEISKVSRLVAILAIGLGAVFFGIGQLLGLPILANFIFAVGIIVANVPEGLLPTVTLSLAMATQRMAKRNALVRHLPAVETLGAATVICTDKTGTLTENRMTAKRLFAADGMRELAQLDAQTAASLAPLFETALLCQSLRTASENGRPTVRGDPMEIALVAMAETAGCRTRYEQIGEVPFDAERRRMSTAHRAPQGKVLYCKGAPEAVLPLCTQVLAPGGTEILAPGVRDRYVRAQAAMAEDGLRVLAFAYRLLPADAPEGRWEEDLILAGLIGLEDPPRAAVPDAVKKCHAAGIKVIMVTGDHPHTACAIAREIGLAQAPHVVIGDELRRTTDTQLQLVLDAPEIIFARVTADQKLRVVDALRRKGHVVAATGDGVNDAPALKRADIGIAMGVGGTDVAREAADMILLDDDFASIVNAIEEGRAVYQNIRKFLTYILTSNIPELVPYLAFVVLRIPLPLTIIQILAVDLGTDMVPALALGAEQPDPKAMQAPPRSRSARLLDWPLLARAYLFLGLIEAGAAMAAYFFVLSRGGWEYGQMLAKTDPLYLQATTACLAAIVLTQMVNVFMCRHPRESVLAFSFTSNILMLGGVCFELILILAICYTPWGNAIFGTAPLGLDAWLFVLPFAALMLALEEARKMLVRRHSPR